MMRAIALLALALLGVLCWLLVPRAPPGPYRNVGTDLYARDGHRYEWNSLRTALLVHHRKLRSHKTLEKMGVPVDDRLPFTEDFNRTRHLRPPEVIRRLLALATVAAKISVAHEGAYRAFTERYRTAPYLTAQELRFVRDPSPLPEAVEDFRWRTEAALPLVWALKLTREIEAPTRTIDIGTLLESVREIPADNIYDKVRLRRQEKILAEVDLAYRIRWAVQDAAARGAPPPGGLIPRVTEERLRALNWLVGFESPDWETAVTDVR